MTIKYRGAEKSHKAMKRAMVSVGLPDSISLYVALQQFENEILFDLREAEKQEIEEGAE